MFFNGGSLFVQMPGDSNTDFFYSHNVELGACIDRHALREEYLIKYGGEILLGPSWDERQRKFVDAKTSVGVFVRDGAGQTSLENAIRQAYQSTGILCVDLNDRNCLNER